MLHISQQELSLHFFLYLSWWFHWGGIHAILLSWIRKLRLKVRDLPKVHGRVRIHPNSHASGTVLGGRILLSSVMWKLSTNWLSLSGRKSKKGNVDQRVKSFSYARWINSGYLIYSMETIINTTVYLKFLNRVDLKCSHHTSIQKENKW